MYSVDISEEKKYLIEPEDSTYKVQKSTSKSSTHHNENQNQQDDPNADSDDENFHGVNVGHINPGIENYVGKNIPILVLITIKLLTQHITGFVIIIACFIASRCANERVRLFDRRSVQNRRSSVIETMSIILLMVVNLCLLYVVIEKEDGGVNVICSSQLFQQCQIDC